MKEVRSSLQSIMLSSARVEGVLSTLATKADVEKNAGDIRSVAETLRGFDTRLSTVESGSLAVANAAISKNIGPWQLPAVLAATIIVGGAAMAGAGWPLRFAGIIH